MTKKLEELFSLPSSAFAESEIAPDEAILVTVDALSNLEKIESALPAVRGLEAADSDMDELADMAKNSYKDLMDLGLQVEARFSAEIFNSAGTFLGHAITAKTAKLNKKLKMIELQLKKAALDQKVASKVEEIESTPLGDARALDRNELLKILSAKNN
jgi:hypothetical protein